MRAAVILLAAFTVAYGEVVISTLPVFLYEKLPDLYRDFIPDTVRHFFINLAKDEKILILEFATLTGDFANLKTDEEVWTLLKTKNTKLYERTYEIREWIETRFEKLTPEARKFIIYLFERLRIVYTTVDNVHLQENAKLIIEQYKLLKEIDQLSLKTNFLWIYDYITSVQFTELSEGVFFGLFNFHLEA